MSMYIIAALLFIIGYYLSLRARPHRRCPACKGEGYLADVHGSIPARCRDCGGTGRLDRLGVRAFANWSDSGPAQGGPLRRMIEDSGAKAATSLAGWLVGSKHAELRGAWAADLCGEPGGKRLTPGQRLYLAAGFVRAAVLIRLQGVTDLAWRPVEALLGSWHGSQLAMCLPVTVASGLFLSHDGFYGLITNAENLGVIAAASYAAIQCLRRYRQIDTPKRPEKKQQRKSATSGSTPER
jgi:hypothetical protein